MPSDNAQGKGLDPTFDPKAQGNGGNSAWGQGRGRADAEEKGSRSDEAPKGGHGLGRDRADESDGDDTATV